MVTTERYTELKAQLEEALGCDVSGMTVRSAFLACEHENITVYWGFWTELELNYVL